MILSSTVRSYSRNKAIFKRQGPPSPIVFVFPQRVLHTVCSLDIFEATGGYMLSQFIFFLPASFFSFKVSSLKCLIHLTNNLNLTFEGLSLPLISSVSSPINPRVIARLSDSLTMILVCSSQFPSTAFHKHSFLIKTSLPILKQKQLC